MTNSTSDEHERLKQAPERIWTVGGTSGHFYPTQRNFASVEYVRADLLDHQAAGDIKCLHCDWPIQRIGSAWLHVETKLVSCRKGKSQEYGGIYRAEPATAEASTIQAAEWFSDWPAESGFYWLRGWRHYGDLPINVEGDTFWMMFNLARNHRTDLDDSEDVQFLGPVTPYSAIIAATRMRDKCVATVNEFDGWVWCRCSDCKADSSSHAVDVHASLTNLATDLQSLTLDNGE